MKKQNVVSLKNLNEDLLNRNLYVGAKGIILECIENFATVIFFNDKIKGDYAVVKVEKNYLQICENMKLSKDLIKEFEISVKNNHKIFTKKEFEKLNFQEFDMVELIVEDEAYAKLGIHKGFVGAIAIDHAMGNKILVDFTQINSNGKFYGDCITVDMKDIKLIDKKTDN